tara:strand:- start:89 stop:805 length:717 start_codon:yes stop_codon:yes gene_type:complete
MTQLRLQVPYGASSIEFALSRRDRQTLEIAVEPDMSVNVVAPLNASVDAILAKVRKRARWIKQQQRYFLQYMPRTPDRQYVSGETHLYLGWQYRLRVSCGQADEVKLVRGFLNLETTQPDNPDIASRLVSAWYQKRAREVFSKRLELNLERFPDPNGYRPRQMIVRDLTHRWGSMSPGNRLMLNRRLVEAPVDTIDYVITHELCHVSEPNHGPGFVALLNRILPDWEQRKHRLERLMA